MSSRSIDRLELPERDHRRLGRELELFSFSESVGPGLVLWHPKGALVRHLLENYWRREQLARGYELVYSPHVGRSFLWETSGHLDFYRESMFPPLEIDDRERYYLKPMNCPFHMQIFASRLRSYRELPIRYAELGTVYRYERSGVLAGLLRVRGFTQDDAHIFCRAEDLEVEIEGALRFVSDFLASFEFRSLSYSLSTRPAHSVGEDADWSAAEAALSRALDRRGLPYEVDAGGGAFYGPKIDVQVEDSLARRWQLSTVQLDFNLPLRFGLSYVGPDGAGHRPYVLHRALFGSLERFFAVLLEHYRGAFPFWLAPVQARVVPVSERHSEKAHDAARRLKDAGIRADVDDRGEPLAARIRDGELEKIPYLLVIGDREVEDDSVSVRERARSGSTRAALSEWISQRRDPDGPV